MTKVRLNKFIADSSIASRREADRLMESGRVKVNGAVVGASGCMIDPQLDVVMVDGKTIQVHTHQTFLFHKPRNTLCTRSDDRGRPTIYDQVDQRLEMLDYVGRLDFDTSGVLLLTSDGELARRLTLPAWKIERTYDVLVAGRVPESVCTQLETGIEVDGMRLRARSVRIGAILPDRTSLEVVLQEGRNREIRRMFECVSHPVVALVRTSFAGLTLGTLQPGQSRQLSASEEKALYTSVGLQKPLAGPDFTS